MRSYHAKQKQDSWRYSEADGTVLGQKVTPLDRAGLYVPGGKASYPSSVLMNAIPAKVAGVPEVVMVVPTPRGEINEIVLAAARLPGPPTAEQQAALRVIGHTWHATLLSWLSGRSSLAEVRGDLHAAARLLTVVG